MKAKEVSTETKTALITGASSGIGKAFAHQLASMGYDLVLTARRIERLQAIQQDIVNRFQTSVEIIPADLSRDSDQTKLVRWIEDGNRVELLINNAGFGLNGAFARVPEGKTLDMIQVHLIASLRLTHAVLPDMISNGGSIIFVSSMAGLTPVAGPVYSATKSFLNTFSELLQMELRSGVSIQALCPGMTYTEFHDTEAYCDFDRSVVPKIAWMSADKVVARSLKSLGKRVIVVPGWLNKVAWKLSPFLLWIARKRVIMK